MGDAQILLGTSGWTADGWVGRFYADHCQPRDFIPRYAEHFNTVEIDSTFYRIPSNRTVKQWKERTLEGFIFAAKVPQTITHEKVLVDAEDDLMTFLKTMEILGDKLGPVPKNRTHKKLMCTLFGAGLRVGYQKAWPRGEPFY